MASPNVDLTRAWTHTLPDARALDPSNDFPRRKSASSLPASSRTRKLSAKSTASPTTAPTTPSFDSASAASLGPWAAGPSPTDPTHPKTVKKHKLHSQSRSSLKPLPKPPPLVLSHSSLEPRPSLPLPDSPLLPPPSPGSTRDSFVSIVDDPFFQRYHTPSTDWFGDNGTQTALPPPQPSPLDPSPAQDQSRHEPSPPSPWPLPERESLIITDRDSLWTLPPPPPVEMDAINIAVIGANGVGKTAFIQRALRQPKPPSTNITAIRLDIEGIPHVVALIELDLEYFDVDPTQKIQWPKQINGHMVPRIDGALILYDVMNKDSIRELPAALSALNNSGLPTILVATKCDNPESTRQISTDGMAKAFPSVITDFQTSANVSANTRDCLQAIILAVYNRKGADKSNASTRRRAASSAGHLDTPDSLNSRLLGDQSSSKHSRASSDLSLLRGGPSVAAEYRSQHSRSPRIEYHSSPQLSGSFSSNMNADNGTPTGSTNLRLTAGQNSFLDVDESDAESFRYSEEIPILQRNDETIYEKPVKLAGTSFEELVDRVLAAPMSRADNNFSDVFLCLYRKFAAPGQLLSAIIKRLNATWENKSVHYLERTATQFRMIEVVACWVSLYPGDFARPRTRSQLENLMKRLSDEPIFAIASQQMRDHLENDVMEDDDTGWAQSDDTEEEDTAGTSIASSDVTTLAGTSSSKRGSDSVPAESMQSLRLEDSRSSQRRPSSDVSSGAVTAPGGADSTQFKFHSYEDYEREAATMIPRAILPLNKNRYSIFIALDPDDVADEITRIDWIMFSSIRIRDLVRHVSLSLQEKERCRSLKNVNRMISHFNHVAKWVANMILIRDKAKHRAPCLQRFMQIALRLRQLNNYNGLAAVLAGINGTAIHRLAQTRALVDPDLQKRFARLVLLMGTQKSHFAYRLAWENSSLPRIPFMPLHRRDLVSAEEGSRTFVGPEGNRINWKKFEVLGEVLLPIMRSQGTPYPNLKKHEISRELILDCRMPMDDEEIYQRSMQVEPTGTGSAMDQARKKFPWLPK